MSKIIVVGSSNTDMVVHTSHLPAPGETILGGKFLMNQGDWGVTCYLWREWAMMFWDSRPCVFFKMKA